MVKYEIDYIEFWATGHCNLNCKGCSSCSPLAKPWFLAPQDLKKDLMQLRRLQLDIHNITILGGEPLLNPEITKIMETVKEIYPHARLGIITNGFLLLQMNELFWETCSKFQVKFCVTCFPVMRDSIRESIEMKFKSFNLDFNFTLKKKFNKILTQDHSGDINEIAKVCRCNHAYNLKAGKISRCTVSMAVPLLNERFHAGMIESGVLDIYEMKSGKEIIDFLEKPNESCLNCSSNPIRVDWELAKEKPELSDWII